MATAEGDNVDFRADRMPSAEGRGRAVGNLRRAWDAYARAVNKASEPVLEPLLRPVAQKVAAPLTIDLVGFWLTWHLEGGFEGLQRLGMSRASIYRRIGLFRKTFGAHPDEFEMPGVQIDLDAYLRTSSKTIGPRETHPRSKSQSADN